MASELIILLGNKNKFKDNEPILNRVLFLISIFKERDIKYRNIKNIRNDQKFAYHLSESKYQYYSVVYNEHTLFGCTIRLCSSTEGDLEYKLIEFGRKILKIISTNPEIVKNEHVSKFINTMKFKNNEFYN